MSQEGRIGGPLLAQNLLRNGTDLSFETSLLYFNVGSQYLGINTQGPGSDLTIGTVKNNGGTTNGKIGTVNLLVDTTANIGNFAIGTSTIQHLTSSITITPASSGTSIMPRLSTSSLYSYGNIVTTTVTNDNINFTPNSSLVTTGSVQNQAGLDNATGLFTGGFSGANVLGRVVIGWKVVGQPTWTVTAIDSGAQTITISGGMFLAGSSYQFTGLSSGDINFANGNGNVTVDVNAGLHATGNITWDGNITLGNQTTDTITFAAEVKSDILPQVLTSLITPVTEQILTEALDLFITEDAQALFTDPAAPYIATTYLYNLGSNSLKWKNIYATTLNSAASGVSSAISASNISIGNFILNSNNISNANNDISFSTTGTGQVKFNAWPYINGSIITGGAQTKINILSQNSPLFIGIDDENLLFTKTTTISAFNISSTGNGYVKITGTTGLVLPVGTTTGPGSRPLNPETGATRWNSIVQYVEIYSGSAWIPAYGTAANATATDVDDVSTLYSIVFGY
jgi:hypothetical protein